MKTDFIIPGAMKCGTTTLAKVLSTHRDIIFSDPKEPQFFSNFKNPNQKIDEYHDFFSNHAQGVLYGEGSTNYTKFPNVKNLTLWEDIYEYNPDMKFIYMVRNPLDRIVSHYMHAYARGFIECSLSEAIRKNAHLINTSRYYTQIKKVIDLFGRDQVLILTFEEITTDLKNVLKKVTCFLDIESKGFSKEIEGLHKNRSLDNHRPHVKFTENPNLFIKILKKNIPSLYGRITDNSDRAFKVKPKLKLSEKKVILQMLELEIDGLQSLIKRDLSSWREI